MPIPENSFGEDAIIVDGIESPAKIVISKAELMNTVVQSFLLFKNGLNTVVSINEIAFTIKGTKKTMLSKTVSRILFSKCVSVKKSIPIIAMATQTHMQIQNDFNGFLSL